MKYLLAISLMLLVFSCKSEKEDDLVYGSSSALVGTWVSTCVDRSDEYENYSNKFELSITSVTYERSVKGYISPDCDESTKEDHVKYVTTYTYDGSEIALTVQDVRYAYFESEQVDWANDRSECGYNDWQLGIEKSVIDILDDCVIEETQGTVMNIPVSVSGNTMNENNGEFTFTKQ